jgi:Ni,Fe-hydrogenase III large subunit
MSALICGSRFGRGIVRPGGCGFDLSQLQVDQLQARLAAARRDLTGAVNLLWSTPSVMNRLEGTGVVTGELAEKLALVGPAARASGLSRDVRKDYPFGTYRLQQIPIETAQGGDVYSRAQVRWLEASRSLDYLDELLGQLPSGDLRSSMPPLAPSSIALALTEGWRGEICHVGITDSTGRFKRYKIVDPSFHNWSGLAMSMRNGQISDFPLCNKSFNLSYCGFDL